VCFLLVFGHEVYRASHSIPTEHQNQRADKAQENIEAVHQPNAATANELRPEQQRPGGNLQNIQTPKDWASQFFEIKLTDLLIAIFTGVLAWKTAGLFRETAGLREGADQQRADMLRSIEAAEKSAATARDALVTTERAFVFLEDFDTNPSYGRRGSTTGIGHGGWEVRQFIERPRWRNNGNTPTKDDMTVIVNWVPWVGDLPQGFSYAYGEDVKPTPMFLGPNATEWSEAIELNAREATLVLDGKQNIFIWGRVEYRDVFNKTPIHYTEWCYRLIFTKLVPQPESQFVAFGPHNGSDEDSRNNS